jgi:hypothetical protein
MKYSRYCLDLALFSVALSLMAGLSGRAQEQTVENQAASQAAPESRMDPGHDSQKVSLPRSDTRLIVPSLETIVARMSQAAIKNETHLRPYTVTREYQLFGQRRDKTRSRVTADVTFHPPDLKKYRIRGTEGSTIGERIVRSVLEREAILANDGGSSDISRDNYNFRFLREEVAKGQLCYVLQLLPTRPKDKNLLRGTIWVDADTYLIRRTEGEPQKNPSWWVRDLHIVFVYADIGGMWLPTSSEFTARVRLFGPSAMLAHDLGYDYSQFAEAANDLSEQRYSTVHGAEQTTRHLRPKTQ